MAEYLVFIHGVNTREAREQPHYADKLFDLIQQDTPNLDLRKVELYWGNVNSVEEQKLLESYQQSPFWSQLCFPDLREKQLMQFTGDAALYISRTAGAKVVDVLAKQIRDGLQGDVPANSRVHFVTHSMGTVILFDVLFSSRWEEEGPGHESVIQIRERLFGLDPNPSQGLLLCSIYTMGSPISVYSLMQRPDVEVPPTRDIVPRLRTMLQRLHDHLHIEMPWSNFIHPADPIAYPLAELIPEMLDRQQEFIAVRDELVENYQPDLPNVVWHFLGDRAQAVQLMLSGSSAHASYWKSAFVAQSIATTLQRVASRLAVGV